MRIMVIPDAQVRPGVPIEHLNWIGKYAVEKKPDVIVNIGDFADLPSLSSYDKGKKSFEGRRYKEDIKAVHEAMDTLLSPIREEQEKLNRARKKAWNPRLVMTLGNHEQRIERAVNAQPEYDGLISYDDLGYEDAGWEVHPFLEVVIIEGVAFSHYFTSGVMGRPVGNAKLMLQKQFMSAVMGHVQDRDIAEAKRADGKRMIGIFVGICYQHDESYLGPKQNNSWRGCWMLNDVHEGSFDYMPVSLDFLRGKYGN
jgi:hypothetical protein